MNSDGASGGFTVPNAAAQTAVVAAALASAGRAASESRLRRGARHRHPARRPDRVAGAQQGAASRDADDAVYVGSVKSLVGHLEAAAGMVGLIKAALSVHHGEIPPHRLDRAAHRQGQLAAARASGWPSRPPTGPSGAAALAGVSAFGFTGSNAHVVLGQPPASSVSPDAAQRRRVRDRTGALGRHPGRAAATRRAAGHHARRRRPARRAGLHAGAASAAATASARWCSPMTGSRPRTHCPSWRPTTRIPT